MVLKLKHPSKGTLTTTTSVRKLQREIERRFGSDLSLRSTSAGYDAVKEAMIDVLADLCHLATHHNLDFADLARIAQNHECAERPHDSVG